MKKFSKKVLFLPVLLIIVILVSEGSFASKLGTVIYESKGLAIKGYDPVVYFTENKAVEGKKEFQYSYNDAVWQFSNMENWEKFKKNPEKFIPQYGGFCAYGLSKGYLAPIDPNAWTIHEAKLYLNYDKSVSGTWKKDVPGNIKKADKFWEQLSGKAINKISDGWALHGYDPVAYFSDGKPVQGKSGIEYSWNEAKWRFASQKNKDLFMQNPEKYAPQYGGYCAYGLSLNKLFDGDPNVWKIVDGKLYVNLNADIGKTWSADIPGNIQKANANWPWVLDKN